MKNNTVDAYDRHGEEFVSLYETADTSQLIKDLIYFLNRAGKNIAEFGSGSGRDAERMSDAGFNVSAFDGSETMVHEAKILYPLLKIKHLELPQFPENFSDHKFDGAYSIATLMHLSITDIKESLKGIHSSIKKDGLFYLSVSLVKPGIDENGYDNKGRFFNNLTENQWIKMLNNAGFDVESTEMKEDVLGRSTIQWCDFRTIRR